MSYKKNLGPRVLGLLVLLMLLALQLPLGSAARGGFADGQWLPANSVSLSADGTAPPPPPIPYLSEAASGTPA